MSSNAPTLAELQALAQSLLYQPAGITDSSGPGTGPDAVTNAGVAAVVGDTDPIGLGLQLQGQQNLTGPGFTGSFFGALAGTVVSGSGPFGVTGKQVTAVTDGTINPTSSIFNFINTLNGPSFANSTAYTDNLDLMQNSPAYQGLLTAYASIVLGMTPPTNGESIGESIVDNTNKGYQDLPIPTNFSMSTSIFDSSVTGSSLSNQNKFIIQNFTEAINQFIQNYNFSSLPVGPGNGSASAAFAKDFYSFLTFDSSVLTTQSSAPSSTPAGLGSNITSYQELYNSFVPGASFGGFAQTFLTYYNQVIQQNGYFISSQALPGWMTLIRNTSEDPTQIPTNPLSSNDGSKLTIIFQILAILSSMTNTLQKVAISQANRLTFFSNIEEAYTNLIAKIPDVTRDDISPQFKGAGVSDTDINTLTSTITTINANYTEQLKDYRTLFSDEAQQQQTAVNQSNETVNQQSDLFTSLLQEMSTVLQSIYHG